MSAGYSSQSTPQIQADLLACQASIPRTIVARNFTGSRTLVHLHYYESASTIPCDMRNKRMNLAMLIDGAWDCRAGVVYGVKHSQNGISKFEAEPVPGMAEPKIKRLTSIASAMDELELSMC